MPTADPKRNCSWPGPVVAAIAVVANLWMLGLDFSSDDFLFLTRVPVHFVPEPWIGTDSCSGAPLWYHEMILAVPDRYIFRPTAWALWWALVHGSDGAASSVLFHGVLLLVHGLTTFVLFRVLRPAVGPMAAALGALAFGLAPGSLQAVTWIAATGDTLSVLFLLLSAIWLQRGRARGSLGADIVAGLCFTLAVASKESSAYFAPAVLLAGLLVPRGERPSPLWRLGVTFAVPFSALVLLRHAYTGTWGPSWKFFEIPWSGKPEVAFLAQMLAPWEEGAPEPYSVQLLKSVGIADVRTAARVLGAEIVLLPALFAILVRPLRIVPRLVGILAVLAVGIIPISRYLLLGSEGLQSNGIGRAAYPVSALVAAAISFGLCALSTWPKWLRIALIVPLLLWQADFLVHVARVERVGSERTRLRRSSLAAIIARSPPDTWFVAVEKADSSDRDTKVFNGYFIEDAFKQPFVKKAANVTWVPRLPDDDGFDLPRCVREHRGPLQVVTLDGSGGYTAREPALPPIPDPLPLVDRIDEPTRGEFETPGLTSFRFRAPVPARGIAGVRVRIGVDRARRLRWGWEIANPPQALYPGANQRSPVDPATEASIILLMFPTRLLDGSALVQGFALTQGGVVQGRPEILRALPDVVIRSPAEWEAFDHQMPPIEWTAPQGATQHVVELRVRTSGATRAVSGEIRTREPRVTFDPGLALTLEGRPLEWRDAKAAIQGLGRSSPRVTIQVDFRITSSGDSGAVAGISEWRTIYLTPKDT